MKKNMFLILTVVLVLAFAVPAFAALSGFTVQEKKAPEKASIVCNPGDCQQACGGNPALCANQGSCDKANCPNYGQGCDNGAACSTGAACGGSGCSNAAAAGCGGGGCSGGGCGN